MRRNCVRFTVGKLLFAVGVVAVNLGALRLLGKMVEDVHGTNPLSILPRGFIVGFLPLLNVSLIGTMLVAAKQLRRFRRRHVAAPRPSTAGGTFFSLQLLVLAGFASVFMPDAIGNYLEWLDPVRDYAEAGWSACFEMYGDAFPWVVLESLILGVFLSGPLLFLAWLGRWLARRSAGTLPRGRFLALTGLVSLGFAGVDLAIGVTPQMFAEEMEVPLDFRVIDEESGQPLAAAFLCLTDPFLTDPTASPPRALTDRDGRARLSDRFEADGAWNMFWTLGVYSPWGRWLEVSAANHQTVRIPLSEVLGPIADLDQPARGTVSLSRGKTPEDSYRDLAGTYTTASTGFSGNRFEIKPDGRFTWSAWSCMYDMQEYGYLKRRGDEIELVPTPHPGTEVHPLMTFKFRAIRWGDRLYLSTTGPHDLGRFCRAALNPNRRANSRDTYGGYLRDSDLDKPQTGFPGLPGQVWLTFVIEELSLQNESGSLRTALESIIPPDHRRR